jgi:hypothetical protein
VFGSHTAPGKLSWGASRQSVPGGSLAGRGGRGSTSTKANDPCFQNAAASGVSTTVAPFKVAGVGER